MKPVLGQTRRGHAVYSVHHDSYSQLERTRHLGSSPSELSTMAQQAHPHYRAVDHEEAAQMHYAVGAFHAARAHEAASAAMAKAQMSAGSDTIIVHKAMQMKPGQKLCKTSPHLDPLAAVYAAVGPQMTPQDAADIGNLLMPEWTPAQHREAGLAQQAIAQMFMGSDKEGHENQAMHAMAAAFVHLSAAGQMPVDCIPSLGDNTPTFSVASDGSVSDAGVTKSGGVLGTTKGGRPVHIGDPLPEHKDKATSALVAHGKHVASSHSSYTKQDHFDASFMHAKAAKAHGVSTVEGRHHMAMANAHVFAAPLKKSTAPRKAQGMITLDESKLMKAAKYGTKPLGTTVSGKTVHGLRENMNGPIANGIMHAGKKADPGAMAHHIHQFNPTFTHSDHLDAAIHHKTESAVLRGKAMRAKSDPVAKQHLENSVRHTALSMAHYHASKATGRGTGASRKGLTAMKSEAENLLHNYLTKAEKGEGSRGGKIIGHTKSGKPIYGASSHALKNFSEDHAGHSGDDHVDAWKVHVKSASDAHGANNQYHIKMANRHREAAVEAGKSVSHFRVPKRLDWRKTSDTAEKSGGWMNLFKAGGKGEGSRGGKIIGHTKSGKPIYASSHTHESVASFSGKDHGDAADAHMAAAEAVSKKKMTDGNKKDYAAHRNAHAFHMASARNTYFANEKEKASADSEKKVRKPNTDKLSIGYGAEKPTTRSGKRIPSVGRYKDLDHTEHGMVGSSDDRKQWKDNGEKVLAAHPKWSMQDHREAATHHAEMIEHGGGRGHGDKQTHKFARDAHHYAAAKLEQGNKTEKSFALDTLSLAKGFIVPPSTYFWGQPQHRVS